jgi:hypothetical protein
MKIYAKIIIVREGVKIVFTSAGNLNMDLHLKRKMVITVVHAIVVFCA